MYQEKTVESSIIYILIYVSGIDSRIFNHLRPDYVSGKVCLECSIIYSLIMYQEETYVESSIIYVLIMDQEYTVESSIIYVLIMDQE